MKIHACYIDMYVSKSDFYNSVPYLYQENVSFLFHTFEWFKKKEKKKKTLDSNSTLVKMYSTILKN